MHFISKLPQWQPHDAATFDLGVHPPLKLVTRRTRDGNGALLWMRSLRIKIYIPLLFILLYTSNRTFLAGGADIYFLLDSPRACSSSKRIITAAQQLTRELVGIVRASR